jgi:hypothetical protein
MRSTVVTSLIALSLLPATALAQGAAQSAAAPPNPPSASSQATENTSPSRTGGITKEQYIRRIEERAGRRAASQFEQMDANHDGVLQPAEIRAWRSQHPRPARARSDQPAGQ